MADRVKTFVKGVRGKVIERSETGNEEEQVYIDIHFQDKTSCMIYTSPADILCGKCPGDRLEGRQQPRDQEAVVMETLFSLGQILATPGVLEAVKQSGDNLFLFIFRHAAGLGRPQP